MNMGGLWFIWEKEYARIKKTHVQLVVCFGHCLGYFLCCQLGQEYLVFVTARSFVGSPAPAERRHCVVPLYRNTLH